METNRGWSKVYVFNLDYGIFAFANQQWELYIYAHAKRAAKILHSITRRADNLFLDVIGEQLNIQYYQASRNKVSNWRAVRAGKQTKYINKFIDICIPKLESSNVAILIVLITRENLLLVIL